MPKEQKFNEIIDSVFQLKNPKIDASRREQLYQFLVTTVNGDNIDGSLVLNAALGKDNEGAIIYILTDARLIKMDIDSKEIKSFSYFLNTIAGVNRKLIDEGRGAEVMVTFPEDSFGLRYQANNQLVIDFFQKVDQARATRMGIHNNKGL